MGIFSISRPPEKRAISGDAWLSMMPKTASGVTVTAHSALQASAVFGCVRILAETIASLSLLTYERQSDGGKKRAFDHPLYPILHTLPNPEMTSYELREALIGHVTLWGNAYANIVRDNGGRVIELWPLRPDRMRVIRKAGRLVYLYRVKPSDPELPIPADQIWHIRGLGFDGLIGYSVIRYAAQAIGLAIATEGYGGRFFQNDARPGGVLHHPGVLTDAAYKRLQGEWDSSYKGINNSHRTAILEDGVTYQEVGIAPDDAQFLQTRKFQVTEIARFFRIPPHMLADLERATFSNIEHQSIEFVRDTLRPWLVRIEQGITRSLLTPAERYKYYAEFLIDSLLRGDIASRYDAYSTGRQNGWLSANDVRRLENMNPIEGGDIYMIPLNMIPAGDVASRAALPEDRALQLPELRAADQQAAAARARIVASYLPVLTDTLTRILKREANDISNAAGKQLAKGPAAFWRWLDDFYKEYEGVIFNYLLPVFTTFADLIAAAAAGDIGGDPPDMIAFTNSYAARYAARHIGKSREEIQKALEEEDPDQAIKELGTRWRNERPAIVAADESNRAGNSVARAAWLALGVASLKWVTSGSDTCPYCRALDGKIVGIETVFINAGQNYQPAGADGPLKPSGKIGHPPLHKGCNCGIVAAR